MTHLPLNGERLLNRAAAAMTTPKPSAADLIRSALSEEALNEHEAPGGHRPFPDEAPDGTGASTKSSGTRSRAVDPSQGHGGNPQIRRVDPLMEAVNRVVGRF